MRVGSVEKKNRSIRDWQIWPPKAAVNVMLLIRMSSMNTPHRLARCNAYWSIRMSCHAWNRGKRKALTHKSSVRLA